jgi:hypothetical protein
MGIQHMLNTTITVKRPSPTTTKGSTSYTFASHLSAVPAHVHQMSTSEQPNFNGAERQLKMWRISVQPLIDIAENDQVIYTDELSATRTMEVIEARGSSERGIIRVLLCRELKTEAA